jgi:hypothetical protein
LLQKNADIYTFWNFRRIALLRFEQNATTTNVENDNTGLAILFCCDLFIIVLDSKPSTDMATLYAEELRLTRHCIEVRWYFVWR